MRRFYARVEHKVVVGDDLFNLLTVTSHTLVQRYCEMKWLGPTLRVRLRETGFTVASTRCLKVTGGCLSLSL